MIENPDAERGLLSAAIISSYGCDVLERMTRSDFTDTRHRVIAAVINDMGKRAMPVDAITLTTELRNRGKLDAPGGAGGQMYLARLLAESHNIVPANADHYANEVRSATRLRLAHFAGVDLAAKTQLDEAGGDLNALLRNHGERIEAIPGPLTVEDDHSKDTLARMLTEPDQPDEWLIPGLLTREERVVFVAAEGVGKTSLMRQFAVCLAAGLHPWTGQRVTAGLRVLFIDSENSRNQSKRAYRWVWPRCISPLAAPGWKDRIVHKCRNDGVDIPGADAPWFRDVADQVSPDVILMGSAYKLMYGDPQRDMDVQALFRVIDKVRVEHHAAVLIENHSPGGSGKDREMRPYGSSVWRRWPEIGLGFYRDEEALMQPDVPDHLKLFPWRGAREPRDWPDLICHGARNEMPWVPTRDDYEPSIDLGYQIPADEGRAA